MKENLVLTWLRRSLVIAVIVAADLLWGELFTRTLLPQNVDSRMNVHQSDDVVGIIYKPYAKAYEKGREFNVPYEINSIGLRDREYGPKGKDTFRVLLLGDSFAVSHGLRIEDSLSRQLEQALQRGADCDRIAVKLEVINGARGGYSPYNYWKAYERWKSVLKPDAIVVVLSPDDYDSSNAYLHYIVKNGEIISAYKDGRAPEGLEGTSCSKIIRRWLAWNSEFYVLLRNFFYYNDLGGRVSLWVAAKKTGRDNQLKQFMVPQPESISRAWAESFGFLRILKNEADHDGLPMVIVSMPLKLEIDHAQYQNLLKVNDLTVHQIDVNQPIGQIRRFCRQDAIPLIDPREDIRIHHVLKPCYFQYDGHLTAAGIRHASESIAIQWRAMKIPPWPNGTAQNSHRDLSTEDRYDRGRAVQEAKRTT